MKEHRGVGPRRLEAEQGPASAPGAKEDGKTLPGEARDPSEGLPPSGISRAQRHGGEQAGGKRRRRVFHL